VVLIRDFHEERGHWPLEQIIKFYSGNDGLIRVVDVQTNYGVFKRAVTKRKHVETEAQHRERM
jgi:hypothetical protein